MPTRKTTTSKSQKTSSTRSSGKKVTRSSGKSKVTTQSALEKNVASLNTKSGSSKTTSNVKSSRTTKSTQTKRTTKKKDRGVKHTRSSKIELFPVNCMPWRLEPRTNKFNLSWYMCFDHAVDQIERSNLQPRDYKLMCYTSVPLTDPLTGGVRIQRYVKS